VRLRVVTVVAWVVLALAAACRSSVDPLAGAPAVGDDGDDGGATDDAAADGATPPGPGPASGPCPALEPIPDDPSTLAPDDVLGQVVYEGAGGPGTRCVKLGDVVTGTDSVGRFLVRHAPAHYDLALTPGYLALATVYVDLTTRRPMLDVSGFATGGRGYNAAVSMTYPKPDGGGSVYSVYAVRDGSRLVLSYTELGGGTLPPPPTLPIALGDSPTAQIDLTLVAFVVPQALDRPMTFTGAAQTSLAMTGAAGGTPSPPVPWAPDLAPVSVVSLTGAAQPASGQSLTDVFPMLGFGNGVHWSKIGNRSAKSAPWTVDAPRIPGVALGLRYVAYDTGKPGSLGGGESDAVVPAASDDTIPPTTLPPSPAIVAPADGATDVGVGTTFTWTGQGVWWFTLEPSVDNLGVPDVQMVVRGTSAVLPDLSALQIALGSQKKYGYAVRCISRLDGSSDEAMQQRGFTDEAGFFGASTYARVTTR
jgi:hypothetical protein